MNIEKKQEGSQVIFILEGRLDTTTSQMIVRNVNETVAEIFDVTGFTDILTIEQYIMNTDYLCENKLKEQNPELIGQEQIDRMNDDEI